MPKGQLETTKVVRLAFSDFGKSAQVNFLVGVWVGGWVVDRLANFIPEVNNISPSLVM